MTPATREQIDAHVIRVFPREACGLVVITSEGEQYRPCRNIATTPSEHFVLHPEDYANAEDEGEIVCVVHSHPNVPARPSQGDLVACEKSGLPWMIVAVWKQPEDTAPRIVDDYAFAPSGYAAPLIGRQFFFGVLDCYTLIRDWYRIERNIVLPDFERRDNFWKDRGGNMVDLYAQYKDAGFEEVSDPLQVGDIILMQVRAPFANHAGVYVGDGKILHHLYGRLSSCEVYTRSSYQEMTRRVVRYQG